MSVEFKADLRIRIRNNIQKESSYRDIWNTICYVPQIYIPTFHN